MRTLAGLIATLALAGCGLIASSPDAGLPVKDLDIEPLPVPPVRFGDPATGAVIRIATGTVEGSRFTVVVYRSARGSCIRTQWSDGANAVGAIDCGPGPGAADALSEHFGVVVDSGNGITRSFVGIVASEIDAVAVELPSGDRVAALLLPLDEARIEARAFIVLVPGDVGPAAVLALDSNGEIIERLDIR